MAETIVRRTTLIVADLEKSRAFYQHILGMTVFWEDDFVLSGKGLPADDPYAKTHLVILKCQDPSIGMIGLLEFIDPPLQKPASQHDTLQIGDIVLLLSVDDVNQVYEDIKGQGYRIVAAPHEWEVPGADGAPMRLRTLSLFDRDGYFVELNQTLA